jgi:hypothetical protein
MSTGCSGDLAFAASRGIFSDGDGAYRNGLDCRWAITPSLPHTRVRVVITQLDLLDAGDRLEICTLPPRTHAAHVHRCHHALAIPRPRQPPAALACGTAPPPRRLAAHF